MSAGHRMAERAIAACRDYDRWAGEVSRLTEAIRELECPQQAAAEPETHYRGSPSCFSAAARREVDEVPGRPEEGSRRFRLEEIEHEVRECPACSRLVQLIRARRAARRKLGAVKRRIRTIGKRAAGHAAGDARPETEGGPS